MRWAILYSTACGSMAKEPMTKGPRVMPTGLRQCQTALVIISPLRCRSPNQRENPFWMPITTPTVRSFWTLPVFRHGRLEQQDVDLLLGNGPVFDATRYDQELALIQQDVPISELHS